MRLFRTWREYYMTAMVGLALTIIISSPILLTELPGLIMIAIGVFIAVLGIGLYDQWQAADTQTDAKSRR